MRRCPGAPSFEGASVGGHGGLPFTEDADLAHPYKVPVYPPDNYRVAFLSPLALVQRLQGDPRTPFRHSACHNRPLDLASIGDSCSVGTVFADTISCPLKSFLIYQLDLSVLFFPFASPVVRVCAPVVPMDSLLTTFGGEGTYSGAPVSRGLRSAGARFSVPCDFVASLLLKKHFLTSDTRRCSRRQVCLPCASPGICPFRRDPGSLQWGRCGRPRRRCWLCPLSLVPSTPEVSVRPMSQSCISGCPGGLDPNRTPTSMTVVSHLLL